jgi:hypothetical protein
MAADKKDKFDPDKSICKLVKDKAFKHHLKEFLELVQEPRFYCNKCGRIAHKKKNLCEPEKIPDCSPPPEDKE